MRRIIAFSKFSKIGLILSVLVTTTLMTITLMNGGFNLGIDFQSGQTIDVQIDGTNPVALQEKLSGTFEQITIARIGNSTDDTYNIKLPSTKETQEADLNNVISAIREAVGEPIILSTSFIGSGISQNLFQSILVLTLGALGLILLYIWVRFKLQFALAAILALVHDILFIVGIVGAFKIEVSVSTVAAILTIIGYSLNDTIVIFDRIRENIILIREGGLKKITDHSITKTLSRTLITSLTTLLAVVALMIFATGDIYNFARVLLVGIIEGTWSSLFIATPVLLLFDNDKILTLFRKKQGSGVQYRTESSDDTVGSSSGAIGSGVVSSGNDAGASGQGSNVITNKEVERIKQEILAKKQRKQKR